MTTDIAGREDDPSSSRPSWPRCRCVRESRNSGEPERQSQTSRTIEAERHYGRPAVRRGCYSSDDGFRRARSVDRIPAALTPPPPPSSPPSPPSLPPPWRRQGRSGRGTCWTDELAILRRRPASGHWPTAPHPAGGFGGGGGGGGGGTTSVPLGLGSRAIPRLRDCRRTDADLDTMPAPATPTPAVALQGRPGRPMIGRSPNRP